MVLLIFGSGGTYKGIAKAFKEHNRLFVCFVVEPEGAAVALASSVTNPHHPIQGGGYNIPDLKFLETFRLMGLYRYRR